MQRRKSTPKAGLTAQASGSGYVVIANFLLRQQSRPQAAFFIRRCMQRRSCFLVPRWREEGSKNPMHIKRLKNKLGNKSNASSEIEFRGAHGWLRALQAL